MGTSNMIARPESVSNSRKSVIILDDNEVIRAVLKRLLEAQGYSVRTYACPADFLDGVCNETETCTQPCADVLLSDVKMPGDTGIDLFQHLRCKSCMIRRMGLISGCWTEETREQAKTLQVPAFSKPADLDRLISWMNISAS